MRRSKVLDNYIITKLTKNPDFDNIIIGTGILARDMQRKLRLLGLKAPFLVGSRSETDDGIIHYNELATLGDSKRYQFILCCDENERELMILAQSAVYRFLGYSVSNHSRFIRLSRTDLLYGQECNDAINGNILLHDNKPYIAFGAVNDTSSFKIHILGTCHSTGVVQFTKQSMPEILYRNLQDEGFNSAVYAWGQNGSPVANNISCYIRDVCFHKIDLLILYAGTSLDPLRMATNNLLATKDGIVGNRKNFIDRIHYTYNGKISNGINHNAELAEIRIMQQRVFASLARQCGFTFWDIISSPIPSLPLKQAVKFTNRSEGYILRQKERVQFASEALDERYTKDYSDAFDNVDIDDVFSLFADHNHLSDKGNTLFAKRLAKDIINEFGDYRKGQAYG